MKAVLLTFFLVGRPGIDWNYEQSAPMSWGDCWDQAMVINDKKGDTMAWCVDVKYCPVDTK